LLELTDLVLSWVLAHLGVGWQLATDGAEPLSFFVSDLELRFIACYVDVEHARAKLRPDRVDLPGDPDRIDDGLVVVLKGFRFTRDRVRQPLATVRRIQSFASSL